MCEPRLVLFFWLLVYDVEYINFQENINLDFFLLLAVATV